MLEDILDILEADVVHLAAAMPDEAYAFVPQTGQFSGARTFGEQLRHLGTVMFLTAAAMRGTRCPVGPGVNDNGPEMASKMEILDHLRRAFTYARVTMAHFDDAQIMERVPSYFGPKTRAELAAGIVYHGYEHYGQLVVYARLNGIEPRKP